MKKISQIVGRIKEVKGLSKDKEVADALGISETALYNHKSRDSVPYKDIVSFCEEVSLSLDWLLTGKGPKYRNEVSERPDESASVHTYGHTKSITSDQNTDGNEGKECVHTYGHTKSIPDDQNTDGNEEKESVRTCAHTKSIASGCQEDVKASPGRDSLAPGGEGRGEGGRSPVYNKVRSGYLQVPFYDVAAAAGAGAYIDTENITDYFAFKDRWVKGVMGLDPKQLALISAIGDSMEPSLREGDLILVDLRETRVIEDSIYILRLDDRLFAKRLQRLYNGNIIITSDNPVYEKQTVPKKETAYLSIIGRAVWVGRRI